MSATRSRSTKEPHRGTWHSNRVKGAKKSSKGGKADARPSNDTHAERSLWKGSISFGLVQIPVSISTAERTDELSFHQLDKRDHGAIGYERINKKTGKKVEWDDIVKGYEVSKGSFVIVTDEDFEKANVEASQTIDIQDFVDGAEIPLAYFERPYHLLPDGKNAKAYSVLRDALAKKGLIAIALVVIRTRQHLCAVIPREDRLEFELLRFAHELRDAPALGVKGAGSVTEKEVKLAEQLIDAMVAKWDPAKYKDTYRDDLLAAIREKAKTGEIEARNVPAPRAHASSDLLSLLQASVKRNGSRANGATATKPKAHAAKKTGSKTAHKTVKRKAA